MSLAGVVITRNESDNIDRCLRSLSFCDEIIVVDAESTDETVAKAQRYTEKVFVVPWRGYAEQKNLAVSYANSDWVISIDADEEVSVELRAEIEKVVAQEKTKVAFYLPRKTMHSGQWIRYGGWYPNYLVRLFRVTSGKWIGSELHERWESSGGVGHLEHPLIHYSFRSISDQVIRNNRYSTLGAKSLVQRHAKFSYSRLLIKPWVKFLETYFLKRGFLDGHRGFIIAVSAAYSVFLKWAKLWELQKNGQENECREKQSSKETAGIPNRNRWPSGSGQVHRQQETSAIT